MAKAKNNKNLTGAFDLFPKSAEVVKRNINTFAVLLILPFLGALASTANYHNIGKHQVNSSADFSGLSGIPAYAIVGLVGFGIIFFIVAFVLVLIVQAMTAALELEGAQGKTPTLKHLWELGKRYWLRLFGFYIVYGLMIIGGLILLIVPGLIVLRRYILAPYVMIEKDASIGEAMRESARLTKPHSGYVWSIFGVGFLLSLVGVVPIIGGLIAFVLGSLYSVAFALRYQELKKL